MSNTNLKILTCASLVLNFMLMVMLAIASDRKPVGPLSLQDRQMEWIRNCNHYIADSNEFAMVECIKKLPTQ